MSIPKNPSKSFSNNKKNSKKKPIENKSENFKFESQAAKKTHRSRVAYEVTIALDSGKSYTTFVDERTKRRIEDIRSGAVEASCEEACQFRSVDFFLRAAPLWACMQQCKQRNDRNIRKNLENAEFNEEDGSLIPPSDVSEDTLRRLEDTISGGASAANFFRGNNLPMPASLQKAIENNPTVADPPAPTCADLDCAGVCGGTSVPDCNNVCGGTSTPDPEGNCCLDMWKDCNGVCYGDHFLKDGKCCKRTPNHHCYVCGSNDEIKRQIFDSFNGEGGYEAGNLPWVETDMTCESDMVVPGCDQPGMDREKTCVQEWLEGMNGDCKTDMPRVVDIQEEGRALYMNIPDWEIVTGKYIVHGDPYSAATEYKFLGNEIDGTNDIARIRLLEYNLPEITNNFGITDTNKYYYWALIMRFNENDDGSLNILSDWSNTADYDKEVVISSRYFSFSSCDTDISNNEKYPWQDGPKGKWVYNDSLVLQASQDSHNYDTSYQTLIAAQPKDISATGNTEFTIKWQAPVLENQQSWIIQYLNHQSSLVNLPVDNSKCSHNLILSNGISTNTSFRLGRMIDDQVITTSVTSIRFTDPLGDFSCTSLSSTSKVNKILKGTFTAKYSEDSTATESSGEVSYTFQVPLNTSGTFYHDFEISNAKDDNGNIPIFFDGRALYDIGHTGNIEILKISNDSEVVEFNATVNKFYQKLDSDSKYKTYVQLKMNPLLDGRFISDCGEHAPIKFERSLYLYGTTYGWGHESAWSSRCFLLTGPNANTTQKFNTTSSNASPRCDVIKATFNNYVTSGDPEDLNNLVRNLIIPNGYTYTFEYEDFGGEYGDNTCGLDILVTKENSCRLGVNFDYDTGYTSDSSTGNLTQYFLADQSDINTSYSMAFITPQASAYTVGNAVITNPKIIHSGGEYPVELSNRVEKLVDGYWYIYFSFDIPSLNSDCEIEIVPTPTPTTE